jgi:hypothetical protein
MANLKYFDSDTNTWKTLVVGAQGPQGIQGIQGETGYGSVNAIINGAFDIWQRGTSFSTASGYVGGYTADRWRSAFDGTTGSYSISQQVFTPGSSPVSGWDSSYFARYAVTSFGTGSIRAFDHAIEDARTFAGQVVTASIYLKADSSRTVGLQLYQNFGSGGSSEVYTTTSSFNVTTSWQRFTATFTLPSVSGKTVNAGSALWFRLLTPAGVNSTLDIWGVQLELGSTATPFRRNANSLQGELAACQRYYHRATATTTAGYLGHGFAQNTTTGTFQVNLPVTMRTAPTSIDFSSIRLVDQVVAYNISSGVLSSDCSTTIGGIYVTGISGLTSYRPYYLTGQNSTGYIGFSAEL